MSRGDSPFISNGIEATFSPEMAQAVQAYLAYVAEAVSPYKSGANFVNFLELDGASPEKVEAVYSPESWERLRELKGLHDLNNLFRFNRNVPPPGTAPVNGK